MRVLILGGDGYLGWPTAMHLSAQGHEVAVADNYLRRSLMRDGDIEPLYPVPISPSAYGSGRRIPARTSPATSATSTNGISSPESSRISNPRPSFTTRTTLGTLVRLRREAATLTITTTWASLPTSYSRYVNSRPMHTSSSWAPWGNTARPISTSRKAGSTSSTRVAGTNSCFPGRPAASTTPPKSWIRTCSGITCACGDCGSPTSCRDRFTGCSAMNSSKTIAY